MCVSELACLHAVCLSHQSLGDPCEEATSVFLCLYEDWLASYLGLNVVISVIENEGNFTHVRVLTKISCLMQNFNFGM